jgi:hypothetical protein
VLEEDANHVALSYDNLMIVIWRGRQEPRVCEGLYALAIRLAKIQGTRQIGVVVVAVEGATAPSKLAQLALQRLHEDEQRVIYRVGIIPPRGGFIEAAMRSVIVTLRRRLNRKDNQDVFQRVEDALPWVTTGLPTGKGLPIDVPTVLREFGEFRKNPPKLASVSAALLGV